VRMRNRFERPTKSGRADIFINFVYADDPNGHVHELQIQHGKLTEIRKGWGEDSHYAKLRSMATKEEARKASRAAYKRNLHASDILAGYTLDTQHSGKRAMVFVHQGNQNVIVAHRGTKGLADILTDATAVIGGRRKHNKSSSMPKLSQIMCVLPIPKRTSPR
jgi:hypothetical protein